MTWRVLWQREAFSYTTRFQLRRDVPMTDNVEIVEPFKVATHQKHALTANEPTLEMPQDEALQMMQAWLDAAWEMGIRPSNYADHTNELTATRSHLEDMRALVFATGKPDHG